MQYLIPILILIIILPVIFIIISYNKLIALKNNREQAFADIDVQLKQRYDLIPNLVNTVKGYAKHEKEIFENITNSRTSAMNASSIDEKIQADNKFSSTLKSLFAVAENYPDLKANQNFLKLQEELSDIENKIASARRFFNNATKEFNTVILSFPVNIISSILKFKKEEFFDLSGENEKERENVSININ